MFGFITGDVHPFFTHHLYGPGIDLMRINPGRKSFYQIPFQVFCPRFRHLAPAGISRAKIKYFHSSVLNSTSAPRVKLACTVRPGIRAHGFEPFNTTNTYCTCCYDDVTVVLRLIISKLQNRTQNSRGYDLFASGWSNRRATKDAGDQSFQDMHSAGQIDMASSMQFLSVTSNMNTPALSVLSSISKTSGQSSAQAPHPIQHS